MKLELHLSETEIQKQIKEVIDYRVRQMVWCAKDDVVKELTQQNINLLLERKDIKALVEEQVMLEVKKRLRETATITDAVEYEVHKWLKEKKQ